MKRVSLPSRVELDNKTFYPDDEFVVSDDLATRLESLGASVLGNYDPPPTPGVFGADFSLLYAREPLIRLSDQLVLSRRNLSDIIISGADEFPMMNGKWTARGLVNTRAYYVKDGQSEEGAGSIYWEPNAMTAPGWMFNLPDSPSEIAYKNEEDIDNLWETTNLNYSPLPHPIPAITESVPSPEFAIVTCTVAELKDALGIGGLQQGGGGGGPF